MAQPLARGPSGARVKAKRKARPEKCECGAYRTLDLDAADAVAAVLDDVAAGVDAVTTRGRSIDPMTALARLLG